MKSIWFSTFGPKTKIIVVLVESCVRMKPNKYFISGPARGKINKLENSKYYTQLYTFKRITYWKAIIRILTIAIL